MTLSPEQSRLVEDHVDLARRIATGIWRSKGGDLDDMRSLALMGLVEAATRYDPETGPFENFAGRRIRGAIFDEGRRIDHVPRSVRTRYKAGDESVAAQVEAKPVLIDADMEQMLRSTAQTDDQVFEKQLPEIVVETIKSLPKEQRTVLAMHYYAGLELKDIARYLGVPDSRIGQLHIRAVFAVYESVVSALQLRT